MIAGNRAVAWFLILTLVLEPFLGISWVFAEEELASEQAAPTTRASRKRATTPTVNEPGAESQEAADGAQSTSEEEITGSEKFLTRFSKNQQDLSETARQSARQAYANLAAGESQWSENLDILGPDDTSPVLQDSIFGAKGKERITLIADDIEAKSLMDRFATEFRLNIVSKAISDRKKVKATLYDLPLETVFQVLLEQANLTYEKRNGIFYLQEKGKGQDAFLTERFFKLKEYADFKFANSLISEISQTKGAKIITNEPKRTFFIVEYERNLKKIEKVLNELGYLEDLDPDASTLHYHYLSFSYVQQAVVKEVIEKYKSQDGEYTIDEKSNRFIVFDSRARFEKMKQALAFVDVPRGQVFIDVLFVDLTRSDSEKLGVDTVIDWNPGSPNNADQLVTTLATDVTNFFSYKQPSHLTNIKITGFNERSKSNILNNPKLMVLNNEKAVIDVTEKFPFVTNENQSGVISSKIENVDIGVKLDVMPKINANGEVEMEVKPTITVLKEVKNIITKVVDTNQANSKVTETSSEFPITDQRSIDTKVVVPSGRTLVIGGLIKETDRKVADHIPGLAKLPVLGPLFRRKSDGEEKSQLYIFITPNIVRQAPQSTAFSAIEDKSRLAFLGKADELPLPSKTEKGLTIQRSQKSDSIEVNNQNVAVPDVRKQGTQTEAEKATDKVDFSKFLKKIATLKQSQEVDAIQSNRESTRRQTREDGFQNLIQQLKEDIHSVDSRVSESPVRIPASVSDPSQINPAPEVTTPDKILSERAQKISKMLEQWEKEPAAGLKLEEDETVKPADNQMPDDTLGVAPVGEARETEILSHEKSNLVPPQVGQVVPVPEEEKTQELQSVPAQKEQINAVEENSKIPTAMDSPPVLSPKAIETPRPEEGISIDLISPLGSSNELKVIPGILQTGSQADEEDSTKARQVAPKPKTKSKPKKKAPGTKKVSYFNSSYDLKMDGLIPVSSRDRQARIKPAGASFSPLGQKIAMEDSAEPSWESEFFEKNLAHVTIAEVQVFDTDEESGAAVEDIMQEELKPTTSLKQNTAVLTSSKALSSHSLNEVASTIQDDQAKQITPTVVVRSSDSRTQRIFNNLLAQDGRRMESPISSDFRPSSKVVASSPDPTTQRIFNDLFPASQKPASLEVAQESKGLQKSDPVEEKIEPRGLPKSSQSSKEKEFESFLKSMFETNQQVDKKTVRNNHKDSKLIPNKEHEFMEFLNSL